MKNPRGNQTVRNGYRKIVRSLTFIAVALCFSVRALAITDPVKLIQSGYWYGDKDIREVLKARVSKIAYIAPALPIENKELVIDILLSSIVEAKVRGCALIPVNFNNHWAALAIKADKRGRIKAIYNDSLGNPSTSLAAGLLLAGSLTKIDPAIEWIDLQLAQQNDGNSCGAFTVENLIAIARLNISNMNVEELRNALSYNKDALAIRRLHYHTLTSNHRKHLKCTSVSEFLTIGECLV